MIQNQGLVILFAWLIFAALLTVLAVLVLRRPTQRSNDHVDQVRPDQTAGGEADRRTV